MNKKANLDVFFVLFIIAVCILATIVLMVVPRYEAAQACEDR